LPKLRLKFGSIRGALHFKSLCNKAVHSGRSLPYIDTLIENSHDYLDQTINAVVKYSGGYLNADTLEQVFEMAKLDYESFSKELKLISSFDENNILILLN
ncbi:hypothetical protein V2W64_19190, partial [Acinetobacter baumannii]